MLCLAVTAVSGVNVSGIGSSHGYPALLASMSTSGSTDAAPSPAGSTRRARFCSARRHAVVAMRYSQVRSAARSSNAS
jgi:hypothetical protein